MSQVLSNEKINKLKNNTNNKLDFNDNKLPDIFTVHGFVYRELMWKLEDGEYKYILNPDFENNYDNLISNINKYLDICKKYLDK